MIDTINPMNFDITKNLHGHVRVETRDRWTGRVVDSQEKENLVTNAVQELVMAQAWGWNSDLSSIPSMYGAVLPLWSKGLGGLLLFNGTLTASATNTAFPSSVKLVGMAGQTSDTSNAIMGSLNTQESVYTSNGFTTAWDFLTSQANGTIASLSRTSYRCVSSLTAGGVEKIIWGSDTNLTPVNSFICLGYDKTNKYLYVGLESAATIGGVVYPTSNIYRVVIDFDSVSLTKSMLPPISKWTLIKTLTSSDGSASSTSFIYDEYENHFVYLSGTTLHIVAMDGTHTTKTTGAMANTSAGNFCVTENYYWRSSTTGTYPIYRIEKSNTANVQAIDINEFVGIEPRENDIIVIGGPNHYNSKQRQILYPDGTLQPLTGSGYWDGTPRLVGRFVSQGRDLYISPFYLGTIANLDSPVTKTSSQTMKITYTLTEA